MKWFKKNANIFLVCIGAYILIVISEWVINDLITFRFESETLNYLMLISIVIGIVFGLPCIFAEVYTKWMFLDKLYREDKRKEEQERAEYIKEKEKFKSV